MCFCVKNVPTISEKKRFKSQLNASKAIAEALALNPKLDLTKVKLIDNHTKAELPI